MALQPASARVARATGSYDLPLAELRIGDRIDVRPGERLPADGVVVEGDRRVDQSMLTGEPVPVAKGPRDAVVGGTVNRAGALSYNVTRVGTDTLLARIVALVEQAQPGKLPVQALVDRVTRVFVPVVPGVALGAVALWLAFGPDLGHALVAGAAVLIVASPCALGLATPMSILVGSGRGAELRLLFRKGCALQRLAGVTLVAFDQTGTLTLGPPALTDLLPAPGFDADAVLALAAAAKARSEHPTGQASVAAATAKGLPVAPATGFSVMAGLVISAVGAGRKVAVGSARAMADAGCEVAPLADQAAGLVAQGRSTLFIAVDGVVAGLAAVADPVRPGAAAALANLRRCGIATAILTGVGGRAWHRDTPHRSVARRQGGGAAALIGGAGHCFFRQRHQPCPGAVRHRCRHRGGGSGADLGRAFGGGCAVSGLWPHAVADAGGRGDGGIIGADGRQCAAPSPLSRLSRLFR